MDSLQLIAQFATTIINGLILALQSIFVVLIASTASADAESDIRRRCAAEWAGNYRMQDFCIRVQHEALEDLDRLPSDVPDDIIARCERDWSDAYGFNYRMVLFCVNTQMESYRRLRR